MDANMKKKAAPVSFTLTDGSRIDKDLADGDFLVMTFTRREVESGLIGDALDRMMSISDQPDFVRQFADRMTFIFEGYDLDAREIYQIPECVAFFRELSAQWPFFFHFLEKTKLTFGLLFQLLCDVEVVAVGDGLTGSRFVDMDQVSAMASHLVEGLNVLYRVHGIDEEAFDVMVQKAVAAFERALLNKSRIGRGDSFSPIF
jgi:hypothetical protein